MKNPIHRTPYSGVEQSSSARYNVVTDKQDVTQRETLEKVLWLSKEFTPMQINFLKVLHISFED
ncbi:hypothetical protein KY290_032454 [Solanum tuberosum]|uniref:Uncharacterized protein n=1 Tax=Solanum tuberosum TaxID=4113 RepID=A0ABQ7UC59_SOLTU|nr:hypothetical protein KY284_029683 [Solanum tuberosum]KAH0744461.1 hypothetical protein KY290_032454 [Solanum tuberosum]